MDEFDDINEGLDPNSPYYEQNLQILNSPEHKAKVEEQKRKIAEFKAMQSQPIEQSQIPAIQLPQSSEPTEEVQDPRLTEALDRQSKLQMYSNLLRGFQKIAQAPATAQGFRPDYAGSEMLMKASEQPIEQYKNQLALEKEKKKEKKEEKLQSLQMDEFQTKLAKSKLDLTNDQLNNDPNSENSAMAQERLISLKEKELGRKLNDAEVNNIKRQSAINIFKYLPQLQEDVYKAMDYRQKELDRKSDEKIAIERNRIEEDKNKKLDEMEQRRQREQDARREQEDFRNRLQKINTARGMLKEDPNYAATTKQLYAFDNVNTLLNQVKNEKNQAAIAPLGSQLARAFGEVGVLTDSDVVRYMGTTSWGRNILDWWKKGAQGELSESTLRDLAKNVSEIEKTVKKKQQAVYERAASRVKTAFPEEDDKFIKGVLGFPGTSTQSDMVQMIDPKGNVRMVPKDKVEAAKAAGGKVVE